MSCITCSTNDLANLLAYLNRRIIPSCVDEDAHLIEMLLAVNVLTSPGSKIILAEEFATDAGAIYAPQPSLALATASRLLADAIKVRQDRQTPHTHQAVHHGILLLRRVTAYMMQDLHQGIV